MILNNAINSYIAASNTSVELVAPINNKVKTIIVNESVKDMYIAYDKDAVLGEGILLKSGDIWIEEYGMQITGVWKNNADGGARIIEIFT